MKEILRRGLSLTQAPDRGRSVGAVQLALCFGLFLAGSGLAPAVVKLSGLADDKVWGGLMSYLVMFGGPLALWLWPWLRREASAAAVGLRGRSNALSARVALWGIPAGLALVQAVGWTALKFWSLAGQPEPKAGHQVLEHLGEATPLEVAVQAFLAILAAPLCEEALFRGLIQTGVQTVAAAGRPVSARLRWMTAVGVACVFGLVHVGAVPPPMLPGLACFGLLLGWAYERTGNFWVPVAIHAGFNGVSFAVGFWQARQ